MSTSSFPRTAAGGGSSRAPSVARKYQEEELYTLSPIQLLVKVYDLAIEACRRKDQRQAARALVELISALNFDYEEIAGRFFHLYQFCLGRVRAGQYEAARQVLQELRQAWTEAAQQTPSEQLPAPAAPVPASIQV